MKGTERVCYCRDRYQPTLKPTNAEPALLTRRADDESQNPMRGSKVFVRPGKGQ